MKRESTRTNYKEDGTRGDGRKKRKDGSKTLRKWEKSEKKEVRRSCTKGNIKACVCLSTSFRCSFYAYSLHVFPSSHGRWIKKKPKKKKRRKIINYFCRFIFSSKFSYMKLSLFESKQTKERFRHGAVVYWFLSRESC